MVSLLRLQKNFPLKFVLSRCVILKACEKESRLLSFSHALGRGITVGKTPLHLLSFKESVYHDGFRGKRPCICQVSVNATENPICTARKRHRCITDCQYVIDFEGTRR